MRFALALALMLATAASAWSCGPACSCGCQQGGPCDCWRFQPGAPPPQYPYSPPGVVPSSSDRPVYLDRPPQYDPRVPQYDPRLYQQPQYDPRLYQQPPQVREYVQPGQQRQDFRPTINVYPPQRQPAAPRVYEYVQPNAYNPPPSYQWQPAAQPSIRYRYTERGSPLGIIRPSRTLEYDVGPRSSLPPALCPT